jgi:two-component system, NarL family, invasion response regulator UvrY
MGSHHRSTQHFGREGGGFDLAKTSRRRLEAETQVLPDYSPSPNAGATGYVLKDTSSYELMKAFEQVRAGTPYLSNDLAMQVALLRTGLRANPLADLTPRELQTLSLLAQGKSYGRIAEELNVSYKTVVNACSQLKQKLNAKNLPELIRLAVQLVPAEL